MEKGTKKALLISSALLLVGGGIYLWFRNRPKTEENPTEENTGGTSTGSTSDSSVSNTPAVSKPNNVLAFQKFANSKGYSPKLKEDGAWGPKTSAAWTALAADYNKSIGVVDTMSFKKGQKLSPRIPLRNSIAYDRKTGKALGRVTSAVFEAYTKEPNKWFIGSAFIAPPPNVKTTSYGQTKSVALLTKEWQ
jgi:hypothetical protein